MSQTIAVFSPAKVNLHLAIGPRREDGFHDARSIMQSLTLHDLVSMRHEDAEPGAGLQVEVTCATFEGIEPFDIPAQENIAYKAVVRLAHALGRTNDELVRVHIDKHIPHQAGLGGGSSNAAAALVGACRFWGEDPLSDRVLEVARGLGADVPFFLHGGCTCLGGKGDVFERELVPARGTVVLVKLDQGVSTKEAYQAFDERPVPISPEAAHAARDEQHAGRLELFNNLAPASEAVLPQLADVRSWLSAQPGVARDERTGKPRVLLSGSGSATFAVIDEDDATRKACGIVAAAKLQGWWARSCSFSPAGARIIEKTMGSSTNLGAARRIW